MWVVVNKTLVNLDFISDIKLKDREISFYGSTQELTESMAEREVGFVMFASKEEASTYYGKLVHELAAINPDGASSRYKSEAPG